MFECPGIDDLRKFRGRSALVTVHGSKFSELIRLERLSHMIARDFNNCLATHSWALAKMGTVLNIPVLNLGVDDLSLYLASCRRRQGCDTNPWGTQHPISASKDSNGFSRKLLPG